MKQELSDLFDYDVDLNLAVSVLSSLVCDHIDQTEEYGEMCLKYAKLECSDIEKILLLAVHKFAGRPFLNSLHVWQ